jgi:hypothetical protein
MKIKVDLTQISGDKKIKTLSDSIFNASRKNNIKELKTNEKIFSFLLDESNTRIDNVHRIKYSTSGIFGNCKILVNESDNVIKVGWDELEIIGL